MTTWVLAIAFFVVATVYSMAGFGGGTAYLALLALALVPTKQAAIVALCCNLVVVARTSFGAVRSKQLDFSDLLVFGCLSVPAAWLGAAFPMRDRDLSLVLASTLFVSALALASPKRAVETGDVKIRSRRQRTILGLVIGLPLGLVSGMVGIGGGVFLSPILHVLRWSISRRIATLCSAFILVNSAAGLLGKRAMIGSLFELPAFWALPVAVLLGGSLGARLLTRQLSNRWITRTTAAIVLLAAIQIFWKLWR